LPTYVDNNLHHAKTSTTRPSPKAPVISIIRDKEKKQHARGTLRGGENCREIAGRQKWNEDIRVEVPIGGFS